MLVPLKHIEKGDFGSHVFGIWAYCNPRWRGGARGGSGGGAALLRNVFFGVILTQNLTRAFPGCFPSENTRKLPRVFNPRKSEKSGQKSVTPKNPFFWPFLAIFGPFLDPLADPPGTPIFGLFWPFLALFWPFLDPQADPPGPPKNPHFWPKKGLFWGFWPKTRTLRRLPRPLKIKSAYLGAICFWLEV